MHSRPTLVRRQSQQFCFDAAGAVSLVAKDARLGPESNVVLDQPVASERHLGGLAHLDPDKGTGQIPSKMVDVGFGVFQLGLVGKPVQPHCELVDPRECPVVVPQQIQEDSGYRRVVGSKLCRARTRGRALSSKRLGCSSSA